MTQNILHIVAAYTTAHYKMVDENSCLIQVRNAEPRIASIEEVTEIFNNHPSVKGCGGIMHSYIFNTETKEITYQ